MSKEKTSFLVEAWHSTQDYYKLPYNLNEVYSWWIKWQILYVITDEEHYKRIREDEDSALEYKTNREAERYEMGNDEQYKRPEKVYQTSTGEYQWEKLL